MSDQRNLILAVVVSICIILGFQFFYEIPRLREEQARLEQIEAATEEVGDVAPVPAGSATLPLPGQDIDRDTQTGGIAERNTITGETPRLQIDNGRLHGSLSLKGGRIDDITLADYHETLEQQVEIELLNPVGSANPFFTEFGWVAEGDVVVPDNESLWEASSSILAANQPVELTWDNGAGLLFTKTITLDDSYMFTVERQVTNSGDEAVTLFPYSLISRWGTPSISGFYILHEGPIGVLQEALTEIDYDDLLEEGGNVDLDSTGGWIGITDKYWLTALIPTQSESIKARFLAQTGTAQPRYQVDLSAGGRIIEPGASVLVTDRVFAGAKEIDLLDGYAEQYGIPLFDRAVDFGWFYFLTKPFLYILNFFHGLTGNYGIAILLLTLLIKAIFYPLANKSYRSMSGMKKLQPEMQKLRERYSDDKQKMQVELMALYKKEKVNPLSGCLPILLQIPVFFSLYKVLFVAIELRHAPFFGWVQDLSAPDPTSMFNLFGLIPFDPPQFLMIGVWPILMSITMFLQQRLNPQPPDPIQAKVMMFLPLMFLFLFANFAAGLVIYWTWNNLLSIAQQWLIMRQMGVHVDGTVDKPTPPVKLEKTEPPATTKKKKKS